jgi:galactonate dehydratase
VDIVEAALRWLEPRLVGLDPAGVEQHWNRNYYGLTRWRGGPVLVTALAAVDIALHDLEGKRLGIPVWRLLGGPIHKELRAYYTHWAASRQGKTPSQLAEYARMTKEKGWTAVKYAIPAGATEQERAELAAANIAAVRQGAGPEFDIGIELWESFTLRSALAFANAVAPYRPLFLEEPLQRENPFAFAELAAKSPVPIATGEGLLSRYEFRQLLEAKGAMIIQPDVLHCGGITELRKIANLAETFGVEIAPHQCYGPIAHVASLAAMSVCRNFLIHEWEAEDDELFCDPTKGTYPIQKNGRISLPQGVGLGIDLDVERLVRRFPYKPRTS